MTQENNPFAAQNGTLNGSFDASGDTNGADSAANLIFDTSTATFQNDVLLQSQQQPVLVQFWAQWCGPCKQLSPMLEQAVRNANGKVKLAKLDIDAHPAIPGQLGIQSVPAVIAFVDGRPVDGFMGAQPQSQIDAFIAKISNAGNAQQNAIEDALAGAEQLIQAGDFSQAAQIYSYILQQDGQNPQAIAGLATCFLESGDREQAKNILATAEGKTKDHADIKAVEGKIALAEQIDTLGDPIALQQRIAENPQDYQAQFDMALILNAQGKRAEAADMLLAIMKADRAWNDDGARKQLVQFFEVWGAMDSVTLSARRKLSSLLFS